jgi:hypothetical protein
LGADEARRFYHGAAEGGCVDEVAAGELGLTIDAGTAQGEERGGGGVSAVYSVQRTTGHDRQCADEVAASELGFTINACAAEEKVARRCREDQ